MANMQDMLGMTPEQMAIARQRKMAEVLRGQSEQPLEGQMVSGHYVAPSWTQHLSKLASALGGAYMERGADEESKKYGEQQKTNFNDTASRYVQALRGTPEQQAPFEADNPFGEDLGNLQSVTPAQAGDPNQALAVALQSNSPQWQQFGMQQQLRESTRSPRDQFGAIMPGNYTPESLATFQKSGSYGDLVPVNKGAAFGQVNPGQFTPESLATYAQTGNYGDLIPFRSPVQVDQGPQKVLIYPGSNKRETFAVAPKIEDMPDFRAAQAGAVAEAQAGAQATAETTKKGKSADNLLSYINQAETILREGKATGSMLGTGVAKVKGWVGKSDASTQANQKLQTISGWLTGNVPRFEGPQSDADRKYYVDMAGRVGDTTIPIDDRLAALDEVKRIQKTISKPDKPAINDLWGE